MSIARDLAQYLTAPNFKSVLKMAAESFAVDGDGCGFTWETTTSLVFEDDSVLLLDPDAQTITQILD